MGNNISDYTFAVIKDNPVPLAGSFETFSYMPVFAAVIVAAAIVAFILYSVWIYSKCARYSVYSGMTLRDVVKEYYIHPLRLKEAGIVLDHQALGRNAV